MTFTADNRLSNEERACLLRAARKQLLVLQDEFNRLSHLPGTAAADSSAMELGCLQRAVAWLWRDQRAGDG
jgi:hypothetical protein